MAGLDSIYNFLDAAITSAISGAYGGVSAMVAGPLNTAMAINLIIVGFATLRGISNEPFGNYLGTWLKCVLVINAATSAIAADIAASAANLPDQLIAAVHGTGLNATFDNFVDHAVDPAKHVMDTVPPWDIDFGIASFTIPNVFLMVMVILITIVAYIVAAIAMAVVLFIKFGLAITIAVMPIFVAALIFPSSSGMFFSWLGAVLNYAIQKVAIGLTLAFILGAIAAVPAAVGFDPASATTLAAAEVMAVQLAVLFIAVLLILQAQSIGAFAGGGGASAAGFLAAIYNPAARIVNRVAGAPLRAARGLGSGAFKQNGGQGASGGRGSLSYQLGGSMGRRLRGASTSKG